MRTEALRLSEEPKAPVAMAVDRANRARPPTERRRLGQRSASTMQHGRGDESKQGLSAPRTRPALCRYDCPAVSSRHEDRGHPGGNRRVVHAIENATDYGGRKLAAYASCASCRSPVSRRPAIAARKASRPNTSSALKTATINRGAWADARRRDRGGRRSVIGLPYGRSRPPPASTPTASTPTASRDLFTSSVTVVSGSPTSTSYTHFLTPM